MPKKLLVVGGSHADIPVIQAARKLGYFVITSGNNPQDLGHNFSDKYCPEDYSNPGKIFNLAKSLNINAICASANDFSAISSAYTAEKLCLPGHDSYKTALIIHHKNKFRSFAIKNKLSVPNALVINRYEDIDRINENLIFPLIVKPIDLTGGKGISTINNVKELKPAIDHALIHSRSDQVVVEEFIQGSNHGYSSFIKNGKVIFSFMDDEHYFLNPYLVSGASTSIHYNKKLSKILNYNLEILASKLNLTDGLLHTQFILRDSIPYIIEICRRTPGDMYIRLVEYATGFDMPKAIVLSSLGKEMINNTRSAFSYITRHCVMSSKRGKIKRIVYGDLIANIFDRITFYNPGDYIDNISTYKAEIVFIKYSSKEEMIEKSGSINKNIRIEFQK